MNLSKLLSKKAVKKKRSFKELFDGSILGKEVVFQQLPFLFFLTALGILYIGNRYHAEKVIQKKHALNEQVKELRAKAISFEAELMHVSTQSEIMKLIEQKRLGLEVPKERPKVILIEKQD